MTIRLQSICPEVVAAESRPHVGGFTERRTTMRVSRATIAVTVALLAGATLAACGDDSGSSSATTGGGAATTGGGDHRGGAATTGGGDVPDTAAITITASEYKFEVTGEATGGFVQVTFDNAGKEPHIVVPLKLQPGKTAADALPILRRKVSPTPPPSPRSSTATRRARSTARPACFHRTTPRRRSRTSRREATCWPASCLHPTARPTTRWGCSPTSPSPTATRLPPRPKGPSRSPTTRSPRPTA